MARVLMVDTSERLRESFAVVCQAWGHDVVTAADGEEALVLVAAFKPEVVVLELALGGGLDGAEVAQRIRETDGDRVFIIALTGWAPVRDRAKALKRCADAFFLKPPGLKHLRDAIERATESLAKRGS